MHIDLPRLRALPDYAPFDPITCLCTACMPARCCHCALRHLVCIMRTHVSMVARTRAFVLSIYRSATRTIGNVPEGWRAPTSRRSKSCSSNNRRSNGSSSRSRQANGALTQPLWCPFCRRYQGAYSYRLRTYHSLILVRELVNRFLGHLSCAHAPVLLNS